MGSDGMGWNGMGGVERGDEGRGEKRGEEGRGERGEGRGERGEGRGERERREPADVRGKELP